MCDVDSVVGGSADAGVAGSPLSLLVSVGEASISRCLISRPDGIMTCGERRPADLPSKEWI